MIGLSNAGFEKPRCFCLSCWLNLSQGNGYLRKVTVCTAEASSLEQPTVTAENETNHTQNSIPLDSVKMNFFCHPEDSFMCAILVKFVVL
jgi:hypothetical protein